MLGSNAEANHFPRVPEFYHGKSVFLTGATGFVGSVLLETLLRCCLGIKSIYILLRTQKNVQPDARKEHIFNKKIFEKLKEENPEILQKVCVVPGDIYLPNLGMNEDDIQLLLEEVSIVFHCAAATNFKKSLEFILKTNVLGISYVIELCRKMRKFKVLVYTSTAYCNSNHLNLTMKEEVYRLPFHAGQYLDALKDGETEKLQELISHCKPDWPNSYHFSKCLAENVITDTASDIPVAIVRPSIIVSTYRNPIPGYLEENSGMASILLGIGKGLIKVYFANPNCKMNFVPADIVANAHLLAAWGVGIKRCASPLVVNCTATENLHVKFSECKQYTLQIAKEFPIPRAFDQPTNLIIVPYKYLYYPIAAYYHYLPATVLDGILMIMGKKPRICSLYRYCDSVMSLLKHFLFYTFEFQRNNLENLDKFLHPEDRKVLTLNFKDATFRGMSLSLPKGSPFYDWKKDKKSQGERQKLNRQRHMLISCIQLVFLMTCSLLIFWLFAFIFL